MKEYFSNIKCFMNFYAGIKELLAHHEIAEKKN